MSNPVSIHYDDDTKTDFNDVADALFHAAQQGIAGVVEIREQDSDPEPCKHCGGTGVTDRKAGARLMTRKQLQNRVARIQEDSDGTVEGNLKAARSAAKEND